MTNNIKVSVIVPVYNSQKYLSACLESLLSQDFSDYEIICVNDGSTDKSLEILEDFASKSDKIKIISQPNKGIGAARNRGLETACGEYVLFVDSDDWVEKTLLLETFERANKDNLDIVCFNVASYDNQSTLVINDSFYPPSYFPPDWRDAVYTYINYKNIFCGNFSCVNKLYRREFLRENNIRFVENLVYEDHPFHLESFLKAERIGVINKSMYFYRKNTKTSFSDRIKSDKRIMDMFEILELHKKILNEPGLYEKFRMVYYEYVVSLLADMYMNSTTLSMKPRFYKKMKEYFKALESDEDIQKIIYLSSEVLTFMDVNVCSWWTFCLKRSIMNAGVKMLRKLQEMSR